MKRALSFIGMATIFVLLLAGCAKNSVGPAMTTGTQLSANDQAALVNSIQSDSIFIGASADMDDGAAPLAKTSSTASDTVHWGRTFSSSSMPVITPTQLNDSTYLVAFQQTLIGKLWVRTPNTAYQKGDTDVITRNIIFRKIIRRDSTSRWVLQSISGIKGTTSSSTDTVLITGVTVTLNNDTSCAMSGISDTSEFFHVGRFGAYGLLQLPCFDRRSFTVTATISSTSPDTDVVVVHHPGFAIERRRDNMSLVSSTPNGDGTYTRVYTYSWMGDFPGEHHIMVSAFTKASIYNSLAPVTSQDWGIPYIVEPTPMFRGM